MDSMLNKGDFKKLTSSIVGCLKLISLRQKILIPATTGKRTIPKAKDVFPGYIDADFVDYGCDVEGASAPETQTNVYEMVEDGDFRKIFEGFCCDLDQLCLTQDQIITRVETNPQWLCTEGYSTLFLFKEKSKFFVAGVSFDDAGTLGVSVFHLSCVNVWSADFRRRIVIPQLTSSPPCFESLWFFVPLACHI